MTDYLNKCQMERKTRGEFATEQQRRAANPEYSVWVEASAGTGKTKVLSDRVLRLLLLKINPARILCLTYTKAAAVEMKTRIFKRLSEWAIMSEKTLYDDLMELLGDKEYNSDELKDCLEIARTRFAVLLDTPGGIKIQTIHSFCEEILKKFPLEAGVSPYFTIIDEQETAQALMQIQNDLLGQWNADYSSQLQEALEYLTANVKENTFSKIMADIQINRNKIIAKLHDYKDFTAFKLHLLQKFHLSVDDTSEKLIDRFMENINIAELRANIKAWKYGSPTECQKATELERLIEQGLTAEEYNVYKSYFVTKENKPLSEKRRATNSVIGYDAGILERTLQEAYRIVDLENSLTSLRLYKSTVAAFTVAEEINNRYEEYKRSKASLDYADLIEKTRALLSDSTVSAWVLYKLDGGIDHILLDEAQDTSPSQWDIIKYLSGEFFSGIGQKESKRTIFAVGDRKQSIYSFQGADPNKFDEMAKYFADKGGKKFKKENLEVSFRSAPAILDNVNKLFSNVSVAEGVVSNGEKVRHLPIRAGEYGKVVVWPLMYAEKNSEKIKNEKEWLPPTEMAMRVSVRTKMAQKIALTIRNMVDESADKENKLHYRDFMVLVRHRNDFVEDFIRACKKHHVNISGADKMILSEQIAVKDLISLGKFLLLPQDDLSLAEVLKSPLFELNDDDLEKLCYQRGDKTLWQRLCEESKYADIYAQLFVLLNKLDYIRPYELFNFVLSKMDGRAKFIARMGIEIEDALDEFMNLVLSFEQKEIPSLQRFISWFAKNEIVIKREGEQEDLDAVRLLTVHHSKGLQAPIVFLPDTVQIPSSKQSGMFLSDNDEAYYPLNKEYYNQNCEEINQHKRQRELEEYRRLLYVAMTRAEDVLYICGYANSDKCSNDAWFKLCRNYLPEADFAKDDDYIYETAELIAKKQKKQEITEGNIINAEKWLNECPQPENLLSKPYTPSHPEDDDADSVSPLAEKGNYYGRGSLIHKLLQYLSAETMNNVDVIRNFIAKNGRDFNQTQQQQILDEVMELLQNKNFSAFFGENAHSEVPIIGEVEGKIISAQIDKMVVLPEKIMIVDFKTNRPAAKDIQHTPEVYIKQLHTYAQLLKKIYPHKSIESYILWTNTASLMRVE